MDPKERTELEQTRDLLQFVLDASPQPPRKRHPGRSYYTDLGPRYPDYGFAAAAARKAEQERDEALDRLEDTASNDLDETRRLLYMVLLGGLTTERWYNLAGTLTNALAHHSKLATADETMQRLRTLRVNERASGASADCTGWVQGLIDQITEKLGDGP